MVIVWIAICTDKRTLWGIAGVALTELTRLKDAAVAALALVKDDNTRTKVTISACNTAMKALVAGMQDFKRRYFICPPLTDDDLVSLGLKPHDSTHTPIEPPKEGPTFSVVQMGPRALGIIFRNGETGRKGSKPYGVEGVRIFYGFSEEPVTDQKQLPFSEWGTKCPHIIHFSEKDRGKRVHFALKWEIRKEHGESPWSDMKSERVS
jgi:hypothetical protein